MAEDKTAVADESVEVDTDSPLTKPGGYIENPDHTPNPYFQYGTLETTDLGSTAHQQLDAVSPVFAAARAENLRTAARALDPDDPTPAELVVLPESSVTVQGSARSADDARADVFGGLQRLVDEPAVLGISPAAQEAAQGTAPEDVDDSLTDEEQSRLDAKEEAQSVEAERLAAVRGQSTEGATQTSGTTTRSASGSDSTSATSGSSTSSTPSTEKDSGSTARRTTASKTTTSK
jgi:hypothetical protein